MGFSRVGFSRRMREGRRVWEEFTPAYYGLCTVGGILSAGTTHLAITPLDVLEVNMQVNPVKYNKMASGFCTLWREQGPSSRLSIGTVISNPADDIVSSLYNKQADSVMQWFFYDTIKVLRGLPPSGGLSRRIEEANLSA